MYVQFVIYVYYNYLLSIYVFTVSNREKTRLAFHKTAFKCIMSGTKNEKKETLIQYNTIIFYNIYIGFVITLYFFVFLFFLRSVPIIDALELMRSFVV